MYYSRELFNVRVSGLDDYRIEGENLRESPVCTAKWKFWWENFRGAANTKPRLPNTCYANFDRSSLFREQRRHECELYFGTHDFFSNLSLLFGCAVK